MGNSWGMEKMSGKNSVAVAVVPDRGEGLHPSVGFCELATRPQLASETLGVQPFRLARRIEHASLGIAAQRSWTNSGPCAA